MQALNKRAFACALMVAGALLATIGGAQASTWSVCEVTARISDVGQYDPVQKSLPLTIKVQSSRTVDGSSNAGGSCQRKGWGSLSIPLELWCAADASGIAPGAEIILSRSDYSGMGQDGPVSGSSWTIAGKQRRCMSR